MAQNNHLHTFKGGYDRNFSYLLWTNKQAVIIDPIHDDEIIRVIQEKKLDVQCIFCTHSHHDHVEGIENIKRKFHAKTVFHELTTHATDITVKDNQTISIGEINFTFLHTPGHTKDSMCILLQEKLFTGDLLFVGKVGGTGPGFSGSDPKEEWQSLQRITKLPPRTIIYPGHDLGKNPTSTIKNELANNPFLLCASYEEFKYLKDHWAEYKLKMQSS